MKKQSSINKMLIIVIILLIVFIGCSRIMEQKRVDYYICVNHRVSMWESPDMEAIEEYCNNEIYGEGND